MARTPTTDAAARLAAAAGAAQLLRRLLELVDTGELEAPGSHGARLLRRLEGAASALEATSRQVE